MDKFNYLNSLSMNDIKYSSYFNDDINSYKIFEKIYDNEVNHFYQIDKSLNKINFRNLYLLEFFYKHNELANFFEQILYDTKKIIDNSIIVIYIKDKEEALILLKSFEMVNNKEVMIPFFKYYASKTNNKNFFEKINESFRDDEKLLIINYQN